MIQKTEVMSFVRKWFRALNDHVPVEDALNMLASNGFEMKFPEGVLKTADDFKKWYSDVTAKFFDEGHELKNIEMEINGEEASVSVYVNWTAHTRKAPDPYSELIDCDAFQTWKVVRAPDGSLRIKSYAVDMLENNR